MNIFTLYFILISVISGSDIIKADYFYFREAYYLRIFLGESFRTAFHAINFNLTHSWTFKFFYELGDKSKIIEEIPSTVIINGKLQKGYDVYDSLTINEHQENNDPIKAQNLSEKNFKINDFRFYFLQLHLLPPNSIDDGLSFAFKNDQESSLTHQFYNKNLIKKKAFAIMPMKHLTDMSLSVIYFGGIPNKEINKFYSSSHCKQNEDEIAWSCMLNKIYFEKGAEYKMDSSEKVYFSPKRRDMIFPEKFFDFFIDKIFGNDLSEHRCRFKEPHILNCDEKILEEKGKIYFVIGDFEILNNISNYFICLNSFCDGKITRGENFIFGITFLKNYASLFDYEEKKIFFFGNDSLRKVGNFEEDNVILDKKNHKAQSTLLLLLALICFCGIFQLGFVIARKLHF